jgi:hypothetical protein
MLMTTPIFVELFRRYETRLARRGGDPLVAFEIFRSPGLVRGLSAIMTLYAISTFFLVYSMSWPPALACDARFIAGAWLSGHLETLRHEVTDGRGQDPTRAPPKGSTAQRQDQATRAALIAGTRMFQQYYIRITIW